MIVGEPFASFVLEHHPDRSKTITSEEAVTLLQQEQERGHVHHAFFKDAMLGRFYAICNCCSCCCGAIQAMRNGSPMITSSGYVAVVEDEFCIGCELCQDACNFEALSSIDGVTHVQDSLCMGCGLCVETCQEDAIHLKLDSSRGIPLEITSLMEEAVSYSS
jgi:ferredoxin